MKMNHKNINQILILGGGYAGILAALRLAGKTRKLNAQITLVNGSDTFVERIRLHQMAANQTLPSISIPSLFKGRGIRFVQGWATQLDPSNQSVTVQMADGKRNLTYDKLIYALGSSVDLEGVNGVAQYTTALASPEMVQAMCQIIPLLAHQKGRILVVGGGLTGIEAATELAESYPALKITLLTRGKLGADLSVKGQHHLAKVCNHLGIQIQDETGVQRVNSDHLLDGNGTQHPFDLCLWSAGFSVPQLAATGSIATDDKGRVLVDPCLRSTSHPNIYAVGDCAATPLRMACATAMPMGAYASDHLVAELKSQAKPAPFQFAYAIRCISLGRKDALIQQVDKADRPKEKVFTGRSAVMIKDLICRYTIWALKMEKWIPGAYQWPKVDLQETVD